MAIHIEYETALSLGISVEDIISNVIETALDFYECPYEAEVNVILTDNASIAVINEEYRGLAKPTDVLSFPMLDFETPGDFSFLEEQEDDGSCFDPESGELLLGDIVISSPHCEEQAKAYGHSLKREYAFLTVHSVLHLCGYDHMEPEEEQVMNRLQEEILQHAGILRD